MAYPRNIFANILLCAVAAHAQESPNTIVAISATGGDYIKGAGGTLARFIAEGFQVYVIQVGNDEKVSLNLGPAIDHPARPARPARPALSASHCGISGTLSYGNRRHTC